MAASPRLTIASRSNGCESAISSTPRADAALIGSERLALELDREAAMVR